MLTLFTFLFQYKVTLLIAGTVVVETCKSCLFRNLRALEGVTEAWILLLCLIFLFILLVISLSKC